MRKTHQFTAASCAAIVAQAMLVSAPTAASATPHAASPVTGFPAAAARSYTVGAWYQADSTVHAVAYTYTSADGWRKWFTGAPYGRSTSWARLETTTPAVPADTEQVGVAFTTDGTAVPATRDVSLTLRSAPAARAATFRPSLGKKSGLVTNSFAYHNPKNKTALRSPVWDVTTGSLFAVNGAGDTGKIDDGSPGPRSTRFTGSSVFRMNTRRTDFGNVRVVFNLNIAGQTSTSYTPPSSYDGVHIWLRHKTQYNLYAASVARRDGKVLIKKKCPGGPSNGGTYYVLGAEVPGAPIARNTWRQVSATVQNNPSGSVTVVVYVGGKAIVSAVDTGIGCAPITAPASVGIRGDNTRFRFDDFTVTRL